MSIKERISKKVLAMARMSQGINLKSEHDEFLGWLTTLDQIDGISNVKVENVGNHHFTWDPWNGEEDILWKFKVDFEINGNKYRLFLSTWYGPKYGYTVRQMLGSGEVQNGMLVEISSFDGEKYDSVQNNDWIDEIYFDFDQFGDWMEDDPEIGRDRLEAFSDNIPEMCRRFTIWMLNLVEFELHGPFHEKDWDEASKATSSDTVKVARELIRLAKSLVADGGSDDYELIPKDSHKSFYGKAVVRTNANGDKVLYSYGKPVMMRDHATGDYVRLWGGWSATTGRHIAAFSGIGKAEWDNMPVVDNWPFV